VLSEDSETLKETLADLRITLKASAYKMDVRPLLKVVLEAFFGPSVGLVDMITEFVPSPLENAALKVSPPICLDMLADSRSEIHTLDP
jgi:U5 small nuclear ribonucleoprotein component